MGYRKRQPGWRAVHAVAAGQNGVVGRAQLVELGLSSQAIKHRIARGRLHTVFRGVYAVGRPELTREGRWMAALLACGPGALLSHSSAACLLGIADEGPLIEVSIVPARTVKRPGISVHRRKQIALGEVRVRRCIPTTGPLRTLVDLAPRLEQSELEAAIERTDQLMLADPEHLRAGLERMAPGAGVARLRAALDRHTLVLTRSALERRFLPIARRVGLEQPLTQQAVNGYRVDFYWPDLGLVVETDGLRYHRTPSRQAKDSRRDQVHTAAGLAPLRFSHSQIVYETKSVEDILRQVKHMLSAERTD
jgi:very-short-patch-repair endonuclease